ncbi:MAG: hypothetical protein HY568_04860 [Candidatus Latescibacteria bacterium]|nr:hypothetical protein [Candidatus Latescibacterota bacterium]
MLILIDGIAAGRSPLGPLWLPAKAVRVRALRDDPRRFESSRDEVEATLQPGSTARLFLDLRPGVVIRTAPEPARIHRAGTPGADSLLGESPLTLRPAFLERNRFRIGCPDHADTLVSGESLAALAQESGTARIELRRVSRTLPLESPRPPIHRRRWLQWTLVGVGAGLTGAAAILKREGNRWYDRYLQSSDRLVLDEYFDRAVRYDRLSLASLGAGQVLFTGGLFLLVSGSSR